MAQLLFLVILFGGGWILYKKFVRDAERLTAKRKLREKEQETGAIATLEKDPKTGEYRIKDKE